MSLIEETGAQRRSIKYVFLVKFYYKLMMSILKSSHE